jgi:hypothetical protein
MKDSAGARKKQKVIDSTSNPTGTDLMSNNPIKIKIKYFAV